MSDTTPTVVQLQQQIAALQEFVQSLQQREPQPTVAVPKTSVIYRQSKGLKVAPSAVFDGATAKAEAFMSQLTLFIHGKRHELYDDSDKVILALLSGQLYTWTRLPKVSQQHQ